jgi:hypothetical protein
LIEGEKSDNVIVPGLAEGIDAIRAGAFSILFCKEAAYGNPNHHRRIVHHHIR